MSRRGKVKQKPPLYFEPEEMGVPLRERVVIDAALAGMTPEDALAYAGAIQTYLAFALTHLVNRNSSLTTWESTNGKPRGVFARQALAMSWDFVELNPFGEIGWERCVEQVCEVLENLPIGMDVTDTPRVIEFMRNFLEG